MNSATPGAYCWCSCRRHFARDDARLEYFLAALPPWINVCVEFRHPSWECEDVYALLERHGAAYCIMSGAGLACVLRATAPFVYVRLHGPDHQHLYAGSYSDADLRWWADRIREWEAAGRDVFVYFNNDGDGHAVRNASTTAAVPGRQPGRRTVTSSAASGRRCGRVEAWNWPHSNRSR